MISYLILVARLVGSKKNPTAEAKTAASPKLNMNGGRSKKWPKIVIGQVSIRWAKIAKS